MQTVFEKIIEKLEENQTIVFHLQGGKPTQSIDIVKAIEIVNQVAEQHEECYKDCGDCEAYDKENHHCPKFCKVITEAVKEIEENHNGFNDIVEIGLPPVGKPLIVTIKDNLQGRPNELRYPVYYEKDSMKDGYHWSWRYGDFAYELIPDVSEVIAWRSLPEPYQPNGECKKTKTNFDICCESVENMAQVIDIAKCGWTREEIIKWLQSEVE